MASDTIGRGCAWARCFQTQLGKIDMRRQGDFKHHRNFRHHREEGARWHGVPPTFREGEHAKGKVASDTVGEDRYAESQVTADVRSSQASSKVTSDTLEEDALGRGAFKHNWRRLVVAEG